MSFHLEGKAKFKTHRELQFAKYMTAIKDYNSGTVNLQYFAKNVNQSVCNFDTVAELYYPRPLLLGPFFFIANAIF